LVAPEYFELGQAPAEPPPLSVRTADHHEVLGAWDGPVLAGSRPTTFGIEAVAAPGSLLGGRVTERRGTRPKVPKTSSTMNS
jgi:hypothetical protein